MIDDDTEDDDENKDENEDENEISNDKKNDYLKKLVDSFLKDYSENGFEYLNNWANYNKLPPNSDPYDFNTTGDLSFDNIDDMKKYIAKLGKNYAIQAMITITIEEGNDESILKAIKLLKSLLSDEQTVVEITEPLETEDWDETFKDEWA